MMEMDARVTAVESRPSTVENNLEIVETNTTEVARDQIALKLQIESFSSNFEGKVTELMQPWTDAASTGFQIHKDQLDDIKRGCALMESNVTSISTGCYTMKAEIEQKLNAFKGDMEECAVKIK